jgi:3,4-dehydroadipyl-CoA semialdehyde dehydrogenase
MKLGSYVSGAWTDGGGEGVALVDPVLGDELARASSEGIDLGAALDHARKMGGPALRKLTYAERGALLKSFADTLSENRDAYYATALANSGNTKADAAVDIEGAIFTLGYYAGLGAKLGDVRALHGGGFDRLAKDKAFQAVHIAVPLEGVAVHINAFNFPAWGMWEKAAVTLLSGVPVLVKPATATALLAHDMVRHVVEAGVLPEGALSLVCGGARDLLSHVTSQDVVTFTGSADTANQLRNSPALLNQPVRFNVEADSLNTSILGPDAGPDSAEFQLFVKEVGREMTSKAGQKCTAIRRALVPAQYIDDVAGALEARLGKVLVGNPRNKDVRMGPVVNQTQQATVLQGIEALKKEAAVVVGDGPFEPVDADPAVSAFAPITLLRCDSPDSAKAVHEVEVFGPVCTLMPYESAAHAFDLAGRGGGSLVASVFSGDDAFAADAAIGLAANHGRVLIIDESVGEASTGHGNVMPMCVHGGPGRAGGGEELGGVRGLRLYHQRVAVQGRLDRLEALIGAAAEVSF